MRFGQRRARQSAYNTERSEHTPRWIGPGTGSGGLGSLTGGKCFIAETSQCDHAWDRSSRQIVLDLPSTTAEKRCGCFVGEIVPREKAREVIRRHHLLGERLNKLCGHFEIGAIPSHDVPIFDEPSRRK
jgi:hypothetical protein